MIEELLKAKRISPEQYELYLLYRGNELGRNSLEKRIFHTFMEEPQDMDYSGVGFAFYDGRRSVYRDIQRAIIFVEEEIQKGINNDNGEGF